MFKFAGYFLVQEIFLFYENICASFLNPELHEFAKF